MRERERERERDRETERERTNTKYGTSIQQLITTERERDTYNKDRYADAHKQKDRQPCTQIQKILTHIETLSQT